MVLKNGKFFGAIDEVEQVEDYIIDWQDKDPTIDLDRQIRYVVQDREHYNFLLAYSYDNALFGICFKNNWFSTQVDVSNLEPDTHIVLCYSDTHSNYFIRQQTDGIIAVFELDVQTFNTSLHHDEIKPQFPGNTETLQKIHSACISIKSQRLLLADDLHMYVLLQKKNEIIKLE